MCPDRVERRRLWEPVAERDRVRTARGATGVVLDDGDKALTTVRVELDGSGEVEWWHAGNLTRVEEKRMTARSSPERWRAFVCGLGHLHGANEISTTCSAAGREPVEVVRAEGQGVELTEEDWRTLEFYADEKNYERVGGGMPVEVGRGSYARGLLSKLRGGS